MPVRKKRPVALTIAGSDSGGGAGIQADLKTFASLGVHGTSAITCVTAQNPAEVLSIQAVKTAILADQIQAVFDRLTPAAVKTGMLHSAALVRCVANFYGNLSGEIPPLVIDPVMIATSGASLLKPSAIRALKTDLLPHATLITPNLAEASLLLNGEVSTVQDTIEAARAIHARWGCAALIKGGHRIGREATDVLFADGKAELFTSRFIRGVETHGTGCTLSAAITAGLAQGLELTKAIKKAKAFITEAIAKRYSAGKHEHLNQ